LQELGRQSASLPLKRDSGRQGGHLVNSQIGKGIGRISVGGVLGVVIKAVAIGIAGIGGLEVTAVKARQDSRKVDYAVILVANNFAG
jgi:hypothetical protein